MINIFPDLGGNIWTHVENMKFFPVLWFCQGRWKTDMQKAYILAPATFLPRQNTPKTPMISVTTPKIGVGRQKLATRSKNWHWLVCVFCVSDKNFTFTVLFIQPFENISSSCLNSFSLFSFAFLCIWRTPLWYKCHQPYTFHDIVRGHFRIYISVA